jgi:ABC-type nitrate/sulfonate/bicarbonate transport system permease component
MDAGLFIDIIWSLVVLLLGFWVGWSLGFRSGQASGWNACVHSMDIWETAERKEGR